MFYKNNVIGGDNIKKRDLKNIIIFTFLIIYTYLYKTIIITKYIENEKIIMPIFLIIMTFITIYLLGIRRTPNNKLENSTKNLILYEITMYFLITYGIGIFIGFLKNSYSITFISIIKHTITPIFFIIFSEIIRYVIISANKDKKYPIIIITFIIILLELFTSINTYQTSSFEGMFRLVASALIPLSVKHYVLSYLTYNTGIKSSIIYRIIMDLYIYIVPIVPDLGESLQAIINIAFNVIIYLTSFKLCNEREYKEPEFKTNKFELVDLIYVSVIMTFVGLTSGLFQFTLLSVGSDSMSPTFSRGDAVVLNQKPKEEDIKKNDIVMFDLNGKLIIHRIVEIESKNNVNYYYTKGDANNIGDEIPLKYEDINAKVVLVVPYIGYPNILINEYSRGKE